MDSSAACDAERRGVSVVLKLTQKLAVAKHLAAAELCLRKAMVKAPKDRDLAFALVRVIAWQGRSAQAQTLARQWYADDQESKDLAADLARYGSDSAKAAGPAPTTINTTPQPGEAVLRSRVGLDTSYYAQSQGQSMKEHHLYGSWATRPWSLGLDFLAAQRFYPRTRLLDRTLQASLARYRQLGSTTYLNLAYTPHATFAYGRMVQVGHEIKPSHAIYLGGELRWAKYPMTESFLAAVYGGVYMERWHASLKLFDSFDGYGNLSVLAKVAATFGSWLPELFGAFGHGDASRPYLSKSPQAAFKLIGAKLSVMVSDDWQIYGVTSWRIEPLFFERKIEGGLTWLL